MLYQANEDNTPRLTAGVLPIIHKLPTLALISHKKFPNQATGKLQHPPTKEKE